MSKQEHTGQNACCHAQPSARAGVPAWHVFLDTKLHQDSMCTVVVRTGALPDCPAPNIKNYAHGHAHSVSSRVYTVVCALRNQVHMHTNGFMSKQQLTGIQQCRLLVLLLEHELWAADRQTMSAQLHTWLRVFKLMKTRVPIFAPHPTLVLCMPVLHFSFVWDNKGQQHVLALTTALLQT